MTVMELSPDFPIQNLCREMNIQRNSFYAWKNRMSVPPARTRDLISNIRLFQEFHSKFPYLGYRRLNEMIRQDTGLVFSNNYAHKCCKMAGIKRVSGNKQPKK